MNAALNVGLPSSEIVEANHVSGYAGLPGALTMFVAQRVSGQRGLLRAG